MVNEEKLKSMSIRDIISYENACTLAMRYAENNRVGNGNGDIDYDGFYRLAGSVRNDLYKEIKKRLEDLCNEKEYGVI